MAEPAAGALIVAVSDEEEGGRTPVGWRLQPDLRFESAKAAGRYQARNPASGERFEFGEEEVFLCRALSGANSTEEIRTAFAERFGLSIAADQLDQFYRDMAASGLLEPVSPTPVATPGASSQTEAEVDSPDVDDDDRPGVAYRWALLNPQRGFVWLAWRLAWLRHGVWLLVPGVPLALLVLLFARPQYQFALKAVSDPGLHLLFKLVFGLFFINLFSKLAQGLTCVRCGGRADQFGIRLAYGVIPRFFVGKRLQGLSREQRLWVPASALLTKLALFVFGILLWRLTLETGGTLGSYGFVVGHMALGAFLFTANPLWRADGYVWLTHFLRMPRLRERAFRVLGLYLRGRRPPAGLSAGEKYGLLGYAVASAAFVLVVVGLVLLIVAIRLELRFQGVGVVLFLVLAASVARWSLVRLARQRERSGKRLASAAAASATLRDAGPAASKAVPGGGAGAGSRRRIAWRLAVLGLLVVASLLPYPYDVTGEVTLFPTARAEVHAVMPGVVVRVLVRENQWVTPDQTLAELSAWQQDHDIVAGGAEIERKQAELELLLHGPKMEAIAATREQLAMAQVRATHSRKVRELLEPVHRQGVVKDLEYQEAVKTAEVDQAAVAVAEANLKLIKSPPLSMEVTAKQAEIKRLREQLSYLRDQHERTRLRAPVAGKIVTPRLEFKTGGFLKEGDPFATVEDSRIMRAEILAPETDIGEVRPDAPVRLRVWAYPLRDFAGRVAAVAPVVESSSANPFVRVVRVIVEIPNPDGLLKSQMTGIAKIAAGDKPFVVAFTRALVRFAMIEMWSWLP